MVRAFLYTDDRKRSLTNLACTSIPRRPRCGPRAIPTDDHLRNPTRCPRDQGQSRSPQFHLGPDELEPSASRQRSRASPVPAQASRQQPPLLGRLPTRSSSTHPHPHDLHPGPVRRRRLPERRDLQQGNRDHVTARGASIGALYLRPSFSSSSGVVVAPEDRGRRRPGRARIDSVNGATRSTFDTALTRPRPSSRWKCRAAKDQQETRGNIHRHTKAYGEQKMWATVVGLGGFHQGAASRLGN